MIFHGGSIVDFIGFNGDTAPFIIYIFCVPAPGTGTDKKSIYSYHLDLFSQCPFQDPRLEVYLPYIRPM
jgi:hypothetical protein